MEAIDCNSLKEEPSLDLNNEVQKVDRLKNLELLKKKMCRSHDLIQSYNDKYKECEQLKISLRKARAEANEMKTNYNSTLSKLIKQELQSTEQRKSLEISAKKINELETKISGDQRFIQQLNCKIESIQENNSEKLMDADLDKLRLEEKIKTLELEIKKLKRCKVNKITKKHQGVNTDKVQVVEIGTNVCLDTKIVEVPIPKTDIKESNNSTGENSSFLCKKCDIAFNNLMKSSEAPEPLIEPLSPFDSQFKFNSAQNYVEPVSRQVEQIKVTEFDVKSPPKQEDSETMKVLTKTLKTLEHVIKTNKKSEKKSRCCHSNSCFPNPGNQDIMLQIWKKLLDKEEPSRNRLLKNKLKRCKSKPKFISKKKSNMKNSTNWSIESTIDSEPSTSQNEGFKIPIAVDHLNTIIANKDKVCVKMSNKNLMTKKESNKLRKKLSDRTLCPLEESNMLREDHSEKQIEISNEDLNIFTQVKDNFASAEKELVSIPSEENESIFIPDSSNSILSVTDKSILKEESIIVPEESILRLENTKADENLIDNEDFEMIELPNDDNLDLKPNKTQGLKRKEVFSDETFEDSINKTSSPCKNKSTLSSDRNLTIVQPCKKMVCRRLTSSLPQFSIISQNNSSDYQSLKYDSLQNLDTCAENENKALMENKGKEDTHRVVGLGKGTEIFEKRVEHLGKIENSEKETESVEKKIEYSEKGFESLGREIESLEVKIENSGKGIESSAKEIKSVENEIENSGKGIESLGKEIESVEEKIENSGKGIDSSEMEIKNIEKKIENTEMEIENVDKIIESVEKKTKNSEKELEISENKAKIVEEEIESLGKEIETVEEKIENSGKGIDSSEMEIKNIEKKIENTEMEIENADKKIERVEKKIKNSEKETESVEMKIDNPEKGIESSEKQIDNVEKEFKNTEMEIEIEIVENKSENSEKEFDNSEKEFNNSEKEFENIEKELKNSEKETESVEKKIENSGKSMESSEKGIENTEMEIENVEKKTESVEKKTENSEKFSIIAEEVHSEIPKKNTSSPEDENSPNELLTLNSADLLGEISFSDESNLDCEENESNSTSNQMPQSKKDETDNSNMFISNSDIARIPRNSIHGNRSTDLLLTVISPKRQGRKKKTLDVANVVSRKTTKRNLLTKMRTLKKRSSEMVGTSTVIKKVIKVKKDPVINISKSVLEEDSNIPVSSKRRRIAHTPRREEDDLPIEMPIRKSLRSASKSPQKNFYGWPSDEITNLRNLSQKEDNVSDPKIMESPPVRKKGRPRKQSKTPEMPKENLIDTILQGKNVDSLKKSKNEEILSDVESNEKEETIDDNSKKATNEDLESPLSPDTSLENINDFGDNSISIIPTEKAALSDKLEMKNSFWKNALAALNKSVKSTENSKSPCRKLRSRPIGDETTEISRKFGVNFKSLDLPHTNPMFDYMNSNVLNKEFESTQRSRLSQRTLERKVLSQLNILVNSEIWTSEIHFDVVSKISNMSDDKTAAKCIVDFLMEKCRNEEPLDKSNTPPAPMMTRTQQKIVTLITALEKSMPEIYNLIFSGINFSLFRLGQPTDKCVQKEMARIYTVLARLKKDRERVRLFIIDAIYCYRSDAFAAVYVILTCWSEVFPVCDSNPEILPKCMAYILQSSNDTMNKHLSLHYKYPMGAYLAEKLALEFLSALEKKHETSTDVAIILLAKKMGPEWTQKKIIQGESGLKQIIVGKRHSSPYYAFTLLGNLMRCFSENNEQGNIRQTVEQLCDLLDSDEGSEDHLEGVASALLSFSKYKSIFCKAAKSLLLWKPRGKLRDETLSKFNFFCNSHTKMWWYTFIKNNYTMPEPIVTKENAKVKSAIKKTKNNRKRTKKAKAKAAKMSEKNVPSTSQ